MRHTIERLYFTRPQVAAALIGASVALLAALVGVLLGVAGPLITVALLLAAAAGVLALTSLEIGLWSIMGVVILLPIATLPIKIVITPSFLNLATAAFLGVYALQWMTGYRRDLATTPAHVPMLAFMVFAVFAFLVGMRNGPLTSNLLRKFAEFLLTMGYALVLVDVLRTQRMLDNLARIILLGGAASAAIGIILWLLPPELANTILTSLSPLGYPGGFVLRYIEDNQDLAQRAISTSFDPNVLGGLMSMIGAMAAPQLVARKPLFRQRWLAWGIFGLIVVALVLTQSRAALFGLLSAMVFVAVLRYRTLLAWMVAGGVLAAALALTVPFMQAYVMRNVEGFMVADLATQMRVGEYRDAFTLLARYPVFGVGFAGAPDVDIYLGVANAYLTIAQETGLVGLAVWLVALATIFLYGLFNRKAVYAVPGLDSVWLGAYGGTIAALVVGLADHYFVNLEFLAAQTIFWTFVGMALAGTRLALAQGEAPG